MSLIFNTIQEDINSLPFLENKKNSEQHEEKADKVIPLQFVRFENEYGANCKYNKCDDFL